MVMGIVIFAALGTILGFLLSDILYVIIDPRIRIFRSGLCSQGQGISALTSCAAAR